MTGENLLSEREQEILRLVADGLTNREIAQQLSISHNTVKVHLSNIFEKTGVASRTEATLYAIQHRIVDVPGGEVKLSAEGISAPDLIRQFRWVGLVTLFLVVLIGISLGLNLFSPDETETSVLTVDVSDRWHALSALPQLRKAMAVVDYGDEVFVIAGLDGELPVSDVFRFSLEERTWETMAPKPIPVSDVEGALIGEKIYVPGGRDISGDPITAMEIYDPRQNSWTTGTPLPEPLAEYALVDFEGLLYIFGGTDGEATQSAVWIYDPEADTWQSGSAMSSVRQGLSAVALMDRIVVLGGQNESGLLMTVQSYYPSRDASGEDPWVNFIELPQGRANFSAASINDTIYVIGGKEENTNVFLPSLQLISGEWVNLDNSFERVKDEYLIDLVPIGSSLYIFSIAPDEEMKFWQYQAIYYEIYIPYVD